MKWRVVFSIAQKDIVDAVKNLYILFSLILPVGMSLLLGIIMPSEQEIQNMPVVVYDPENSRLVAALGKLPGVEIIKTDSAEVVPAEVDTQGVGGFAVPAGFDAAISAGQHPDLTVYLNNKRGGGQRSAFEALMHEQVWQLAGDPPVNIVYRGLYPVATNSEPSLSNFNLGQYLLGMFIIIGLSMAGVFVVPILLVEEKEKHTLEALLISPASTAEVIAGKAIVGIFYCLVEAAVLIVLSKGWVGNWPYTMVALFLGSLLVVGLGLFMGSLFRTTHQVNTWASILMLALMMPSWLTILGLPPVLATLFKLIPTYYLSNIMNMAFMGQATFSKVWLDLTILTGCIIAVYASVVFVLRKESQSA